MRSREEIEQFLETARNFLTGPQFAIEEITLGLLLDIRELLMPQFLQLEGVMDRQAVLKEYLGLTGDELPSDST